jgi:hypothetical protein
MRPDRIKENQLDVGKLGCLMFLSLPVVALWRGWCLMHLWRWFAPPGLGPLTWTSACGMGCIIALFVNPPKAAKSEYLKDDGTIDIQKIVGNFIGSSIVTPGIIVAIGYVIARLGGQV